LPDGRFGVPMSSSFGLVVGGKLSFKGDKEKKKKKKRGRDGHDDEIPESELALPDNQPTEVPGVGRLTTSGVVVMGVDTDFVAQVAVGDSLFVSVSDRFRNLQTDEVRVVNMVLGKASLNITAPFTCDITTPSVFLVHKKAPDLEALRAAKCEERKRQRQAEEDGEMLTYQKLKPSQGAGTWKTLQTVTERVGPGVSREDMLRRREKEKADRFCK